MRTVPFRYGFHPQGVDPLASLRDPQPSTVAGGPAPEALARPSGDDLPDTLVDRRTEPGRPPQRMLAAPHRPVVPRPAKPRSRARGIGKFLWLAVVLLGAGSATTVWAVGQGTSDGGDAAAPLIAMAPPTVIEPEAIAASQPPPHVSSFAPDAVEQPAASQPVRTSKPSGAPAADPVSLPAPSTSPAPSPLPSISLPPIVWTAPSVQAPAPKPEPAKPQPAEVKPEIKVKRPTVVAKPQPKITTPQPTKPRAPVVTPKRPGTFGRVGTIRSNG